MAQPAETHDAYDAIGQREDLEDIIYDISPIDTPFMTMCDRISASAKKHEWQVDTLAAAALNKEVEGDDAVGTAIVPTNRLFNYTMISDKVIIISGTVEEVDKAGRGSEMSYHVAKFGKELKRDMEWGLTRNTPLAAGDSTTERTLAGLEVWFETNTSFGAGGSIAAHSDQQPDLAATRTDGTDRALTEAILKGEIQKCWDQGGDASLIMCGGVSKQNISGFTGNATRFDRSEDMTLTAAFDVYRSDFGRHTVVPNRFMDSEMVFVLDPSLWCIAYLRNFRSYPLAKTGDAIKRQLIVEYTLVSKNEKGSSMIADVSI